ncbi:DUF1850 domain-containing protein [Thalassobacillus hwangdonensis]|uniref:DUF1850 domain-containing protein n=1 Tax=Thalassobacillus hwangdonensis TaxID=546108 RepID=A0ABW3KZE7_9BACI
MKAWKTSLVILFSIFLIALAAFSYAQKETEVLAFNDRKTGELLAYLPINDQDHFQLKFTHSVHLSDVYEEYRVEDQKLYPEQLIYEDTAIGMPSNAGEGATFEMKDGKYYISNLTGSHDYIDLSIGQVKARHTLIFQGEQYMLKEYVGAGTVVRIQPVSLSRWKLLRGVNVLE